MASSASTLTALQMDALDAFRGQPCWLTGGGALGGFHLHHRRSLDLDLFMATPEVFPTVERSLVDWAATHDVVVERRQRSPGFGRYALTRGAEHTLVDLVVEPVAQVVEPGAKPLVDGLRVDPLVEIRANKLAAILGRGEVKDLVDLAALADQGLDPLDGWSDAVAKDGALEPTTLAWVLESLSLDTRELLMVDPLDPARLAAFREELVARLRREAYPGSA